MSATRTATIASLLIASALLVGALAPARAAALPALTTASFSGATFVQGSGRTIWKVVSSQAGSAQLTVYDAAGRVVYRAAPRTVSARVAVTYTWSGRASAGNDVGAVAGNYAPAGTYRVQVRVATASGVRSTARTVTSRYPATPRITNMTATTPVTPSALQAARAAKVTFRTSVRYDVFAQVVDRSTGAMVAQYAYRDVPANTTKTIYWNGQVTVAGSTTLPHGESALAGDVAPAGRYTIRLVSRSASAYRYVTVLPTPPSGITVSAPDQTPNYEQTQQLTAAVLPRGAADRRVTWRSSDTSLATVDSSGTVTTLRREGTVHISATSVANASATGSIDLAIVSDSTLAVTGFSVPKWCIYTRPVALSGTVSSNRAIRWVRIRIVDSVNGTEIDRQVSAGSTLFSGGRSLSIAATLDDLIAFGGLTPGEKRVYVTAADDLCERTIYSQKFYTVGPLKFQTFWADRTGSWVFPLDKKPSTTSPFGAERDSATRAHAAIDLILPAGTPVYAMAAGTVEKVSVGTYYAGTGAVQVKHVGGGTVWYCEIKPAAGLKIGSVVKQNQVIGTIQQNTYGTAMLHLEAYSSTATGALYQSTNVSTYDNVTRVPFYRRRDLMSPMGVTLLSIPTTRTVTP